MKAIQTTITIDAPALDVWHHLIDFPSHADWNPIFASIEGKALVDTALRLTTRNRSAKSGDDAGMVLKPKVVVADQGRELRWHGKLAFGGLFDGTHRFVLTENGDGSTTLEHGEEFRGILVSFVGKVIRETEEGFVEFNQTFKERVEAHVRDIGLSPQ